MEEELLIDGKIAEEIKKEDFSKYIKDKCVVCGVRFNDPKKNYYERGNFCGPCISMATLSAKTKRGQRRTKMILSRLSRMN